MSSFTPNTTTRSTILHYLRDLYPENDPASLIQELERRLAQQALGQESHWRHPEKLSHKDALLIVYPDHIKREDAYPLETLHEFLTEFLMDRITGVHVLPFFPYSSDDGFSIIDFRTVNPGLGDWNAIRTLAKEFRLMVDLVINHISSQSKWFDDYLHGVEPYTDYFIPIDPSTDLSKVIRPRDLPLLTPFDTDSGRQYVWTTFSSDQVDLNFQNPAVFFEMLEILLLYIRNGAQIIRLDAIAFLWKEPGTSSIHLPQTHTIVKLLRSILTEVAPWVFLITETNVPHAENLSYFGNGHDEAHLVYQFALPPLTLHTLLSGDATALSQWAANIALPSNTTTFFNFLASHDGIGVRPAQDILPLESIQNLVTWTTARKGYISSRQISDQRSEPYELNITYFEALAPDVDTNYPSRLWIDRYLCSQAIMLALQGVPGIYFHSLFGGLNNLKGVAETGANRTINREKFQLNALKSMLEDPTHYSAKVFAGYSHLLHARQNQSAFNPYGKQEVVEIHPSTFVVIRTSPEDGSKMLCVHNVSESVVELPDISTIISSTTGLDILNQEPVNIRNIQLHPYQCRWIMLNQRSESAFLK